MAKTRSIHPKAHKYSALKLLEFEFNAALTGKDLQKCFHLLGQVLEVNPRSANALLLLGRLHGLQYEYDQAVECFEKAIEISPRKQQLMVTLEAGRMAKDFFDPTIAESFFQSVVDEDASERAKLSLAEHMIRLRKNETARMLIDEVLESASMDPTASLLWCRLHEDRFEECEERLRRLKSAESEELRIRAAYQLGKMLDQVGDYNGAMEALANAKAILMKSRDQIVAHRQKIHVMFKELAEGFSEGKRDEWRALSSEFGTPSRLALLGGHPRSGTTLLEQVLDSHPHVIAAEETENFNAFAYSPLMRAHPPTAGILEVMNAATSENLANARENYFTAMHKCLGQAVGSRLLVDKNPSLTPLAPALFRLFPEIQFVIMIRDPRDVILSCYMQPFFPVEAITGNFLTLEDTAREYAAFMSAWLEASHRLEDRFCHIRYEDMVEDLEGNARKVLEFLGLDWSESVMDYDQHAREKVVRSPTADAVTEKVHTRAMARWKNYEKHLEPVFKTLAPCMKALGYE